MSTQRHSMLGNRADFRKRRYLVSRLLAEESLHYWFEHLSDDAGAQTDTQGLARHVLVVADAEVEPPDLGPIRFAAQHPAAFEPCLEDPVTACMAERRLTANAVTLGSWDYARLAARRPVRILARPRRGADAGIV